MEYGLVVHYLHQCVGFLLYPVIITLALASGLALIELGFTVMEPTWILKRWRDKTQVWASSGGNSPSSIPPNQEFRSYAQRRLERVEILTRAGPSLGLMGTLIPLGPGLTALSDGRLDVLTTAFSVAFDTTVLGLLVGLLSFVLARVRRRWYEQTWEAMVVMDESANRKISADVSA